MAKKKLQKAASSRENAEELASELVTFQQAMRRAVEGDPSMLALHVTHSRIPLELRQAIYGLIVQAPWRNAKAGGPRKVNAVDEIGIGTLYYFLTLGGDGEGGDPLKVTEAKKRIAKRYKVSMSTINSVLKRRGVVQRPPPIKKHR